MTYYFTVSGTSRNACGGVRWHVSANETEQSIIGYADHEMTRSGESFEDFIGIGFKTINEGTDNEQIVPEREMTQYETFEAALAKLSDDGRTYLIYKMDDAEALEEFLLQADMAGLLKKAQQLAGIEVPEED